MDIEVFPLRIFATAAAAATTLATGSTAMAGPDACTTTGEEIYVAVAHGSGPD